MYTQMYMYTYSSTNHFFQCLENFHSLVPSTSRSGCNSSHTRFSAQARRKRTIPTRNSALKAVLGTIFN